MKVYHPAKPPTFNVTIEDISFEEADAIASVLEQGPVALDRLPRTLTDETSGEIFSPVQQDAIRTLAHLFRNGAKSVKPGPVTRGPKRPGAGMTAAERAAFEERPDVPGRDAL